MKGNGVLKTPDEVMMVTKNIKSTGRARREGQRQKDRREEKVGGNRAVTVRDNVRQNERGGGRRRNTKRWEED